MNKISASYLGDLKISARHDDSNALLITDAPKDNSGEGSSFSPTDLFATSLLNCIMTVIAMASKNKGILLEGMSGNVEKYMFANPRRVGKLIVTINILEKLSKYDVYYFEEVGNTNCPISKSIHPDIEVITIFNFAAL